MRNYWKLSALVVGLGLVLTANVFGQAAAMNGEITGTVMDPSGAAISGATVQIGNTDTGYKQSTKTGESGLYRFTVLPLGTYEIEVQASGFGTTRRTGIALTAGATATMDIAVSVAGTTTMVEVLASAAITEPSRIDLGSTLSENMTRNLPLVSRNPYNFILFQPNVSGRANTEFGVPRKINANGFNGRINYQLDGSNNTESDRAGIRLIPISDIYVAEVQQVSIGFAPEFGNTVGTVFNTITKSGANDFHGEGAYLFRRTDFSAQPKLLSCTALVPEVNVDSYSVDGGGRVIKDKLFFFGGFEHVKRDLPGVVTVSAANIAALGLPASYGDPIPFRQSVYFYMGKGDWQINAKNRLSVRYMHHANDSPYNNSTIGGLNLVSQSYDFVDRSHVGAVQLVSIINEHMVNELRGQVAYRGQHNDTFSASGTGPAITVIGRRQFRRAERGGLRVRRNHAGTGRQFQLHPRNALLQVRRQHARHPRYAGAGDVRAVHLRRPSRRTRRRSTAVGPEGLLELQPDCGQPLAQLQLAVHQLLRAGFLEADAQPDRDLRPALRPLPDAEGGQEFAIRLLAELPHR